MMDDLSVKEDLRLIKVLVDRLVENGYRVNVSPSSDLRAFGWEVVAYKEKKIKVG